MDDVAQMEGPTDHTGPFWERELGGDVRSLRLPLALLAVQLAGSAATVAGHHVSGARLEPVGWLLVVVGPLALVFRRRWPVAVLWVTLAATLTPWRATWPTNLSLIAAFFVAATGSHRRAAWVAVGAGYVSSVWLAPLAFGHRTASAAFALGLAGWLGGLMVAAEVVRLRREHTETERATRALDVRRRASEERLAMARDLHDVIGHNVSLINVQAAVALDLMEQRPEQAREALTAIESASRDVLDELRSVLAALRRDGDEAPRAPLPTLDQVGELVEDSRAAGLDVHLTIAGAPRQLPVAVEVAGYRIVQESLTNVLRHAARATTSVVVAYGAEGLDIEIIDDGRPGMVSTSPRPGSGSGIAGMCERVAALGGRFQAGPRPLGGFSVSAQIPLGAVR